MLQIHLHDPGATWLHNAGVVGLWMSLHQLQEKYSLKAQREGGLDWSLSSDSICLKWNGADFEVFDWLLKQSFQISQEGFVELSGLKPHQMSIQARLAIHRGMINTFLQHPTSVKSDGTDHIVVEIGDRPVKLFYKRVRSYAHQNFAKQLCDDQGNLRREGIGIVGWLYPGLAVRHYAYRHHTRFEESVERSFALLFAPLSCFYFALPSQTKSTRTPYALVVPEVENILDFTESCWQIKQKTSDFFLATCISDAGLKFLLQEASTNLCTKFVVHRRCYVVLFRATLWSPQQSSRAATSEIAVTQENLNTYQILQKVLVDLKASNIRQTDTLLFAPVQVVISNNLVAGKPWWSNLFEQLQEKNVVAESLKYTDFFIEMADQTSYNIEAEKLFIKACHEALRKTYAQVYDRAGENEIAQVDRKNQQIISRLKQCHNADRFRSFIADFFAKAGIITVFEENQEELFPITRGIADWRVSRDLFLLAMASYPRKKSSDGGENSAASNSFRE